LFDVLYMEIDDIWIEDLPQEVQDQSTFTFKPLGGTHQFTLDSTGEHGFGFLIDSQIVYGSDPAEEHYTYPISIYGDGSGFTVRVTVYKAYESIYGRYSVYYKEADDVGWTLLEEKDYTYSEHYQGEIVPHSWQWSHYSPEGGVVGGKYYFKIEVVRLDWFEHSSQQDDYGADTWSFGSWVRLDSITIADTGSVESLTYPQTAYVAVQLKRNESMPARPVVQVWARGLYSNPAECIYHLLTNTYWGLGLPTSYVCDTCYAASDTFCDTWNYRYNRLIGKKMNVREILNEMLLAGRLMLCDYDGQIHIMPDDDAAAVKTIEDDDIIDLQFARASLMTSPTRIVAKFNDIEENYTVQDVIVDDTERQEFRGYVKELVINLTGVTSRRIAQQLALFTMWKAGNDAIISLKTTINHSDLKPGDVFNITSSDAGWTAKPVRILAIEEQDDFDITLTCQPHYPDMYTTLPKEMYTGDQIKQITNPYSDTYQVALPSATSCVVSSEIYNFGEDITTDLRLSCTLPVAECDTIEIWLSRGTYGVNMPNPPVKIGSMDGTFYYEVEEYYVQHIFYFVTRYGSRVNEVTHSPIALCRPEPYNNVGFGAGNFGKQMFGY